MPELTPPPREDGLPLVLPPRRPDETPPPVLPPAPAELSLVLPEPVPDEPASIQSTAPDQDDENWREVALAPPDAGTAAPPPPIAPEAEAAQESLASSAVLPTPENDPQVRITVGAPRVVMQAAAVESALPDHGAALESGSEEELVPVSAGAIATLERPYAAPEPEEEQAPAWGDEPHEVQALSEKPTSPEVAPVDVSDLPVIPFKPQEADGPGGEPMRPFLSGDREGLETEPADVAPVRSWEPPAASGPEAPAIRMAPLVEDDVLDDWASQRGGRGVAHRSLISFGAFLSRCLEPINRLERGLPPFPGAASGGGGAGLRAPRAPPMVSPPSQQDISPVRPVAEEPSLFAGPDHGAPEATDEPSVIRLKPLEDDEDEAPFWDPSKSRQLLARARTWVARPAAWVGHLKERARPEAPTEPAPPRATEPAPRVAVEAPPAIAELPVLRFATVHEPALAEDVYEGDEGEQLVPRAWLWTKRLTLAAAVLAGAAFAALTFDTWSPRAAEIGETTLSGIDQQVRSHHLAGQRREAVAEVADELPQLDADTIGRVMAASPTGLLDAAGVFERARDATDSGIPALTASDARELETLEERLIHGLLPAEQERLRDFDLARARGAAFPQDARQALLVYARGARQLPPATQERLRRLLGRAVTAGLGGTSQATVGVEAR